ncbi:MAG: PaaI family thioesterase [Chlamydiia bacterium]|nr:PaaI family thioesterase [Chlamydiia bacterium]
MTLNLCRKLEEMYHQASVNNIYRPTLSLKEGASIITMPVDPKLFHAAAALHGSVYFKMLDDAAYFAAQTFEHEFFLVTSQFNIYFHRSVNEGVLRAEGAVTHRSRSLTIATAQVFDDAGRLAASGSGIFVKSKKTLSSLFPT